MRLFTALELPAHAKDAVRETQRALAKAGARCRWSAPETAHVTIHFLGETPEAVLPALSAGLAAVAAASGPVELALEGLGFFGRAASPHAVYAGLAGDREALHALEAEARAALTAAGLPLELRRYRPHVTLGRGCKTPLPAGIAPASAAWTARELVLFRSHLRPEGARHEALVRFLLGGA